MNKNDFKTEMIKREIRNSDGYEYTYELTATRSKKVASYRIPLYSIKVSMKGDGVNSEHELKDIFADGGKAALFFDELVENLATPLDLPYILEDKIMV